MKHIISIKDFSKQDIDDLINLALEIKNTNKQHNLNKKIASLFFENSTRTRVSSETAAQNLNCYINGFSGAEGTSVKKGEPFKDTIKMFQAYDYKAIIMRHNLEGSARFAADNSDIPIINGGDGSNSHPTQTLLDLMTIKEIKHSLDNLKIALVGDLRYGRTTHSLLQSFKHYNIEVYLVSPENLKMPQWRIKDFKKNIITTQDLKKTIKQVDVLYMTRIQRERFPKGPEGELEYKKVSGIYKITKEILTQAKKDLIILHPLPRCKHDIEIHPEVDQTNHAKYFEQAKNGMYMRQAILLKILNKELKGKQPQKQKQENLWIDLPIKNGQKIGKNFLYKLKNGTLIDHIKSGKGFQVTKALGLQHYKETAMIHAKNMYSSRFETKDVIGIKDKELTEQELSRLALVSERATVNIIRDNKVVKKGKVNLPNIIKNFIQCQNPNCISRPEHLEFAQSIFYVENKEPLKVRCHYCETPLEREEIVLI